jgi:hypothetical protein
LNSSIEIEARCSDAEKKQTLALLSSFSILLKSSMPSIFGILMSKSSNWYKSLLKFCNAVMGSTYASTSKSFRSSSLLTRYTISGSSSTSNILSFALLLLVVRHIFRCLIVYMYYKYYKSAGGTENFVYFI